MDNLNFHKMKVVREAIEAVGATPIYLPTYSPELNPIENIWQYLKHNFLNNRVFPSYTAILDACCNAWNRLCADKGRIRSITTRDWVRTVGV